jgi:hypothetical protein
MLPLPPEPLPDLEDAEALALGKCYALARARARQLREQKTLSAVSLGGAAADSAKQGDTPKRATHEQV